MALPSLQSVLTATALLISTVSAINPQLVGTWTSKSAKVLTGPGFYNPINDSFIEPKHTGIAYSFTADGFYEEAYYRAVANPTKPTCPQSILQFQHGAFTENTDGSLTLIPIGIDGRQLQSDPCAGSTATYTRYSTNETMQKYTVSTDKYKQVKRLDLFQFDGSPIQPLYLAYQPPLMLPTQTMNPTGVATAKPSSKSKVKRSFIDGMELPLNKDAKHIRREERSEMKFFDANLVWWAGLGMTIVGGAAYML